MRLTERDQKLIRWANGSGFVTVQQVGKFMGVDFSTAARRVRKLCSEGLLERKSFPAATTTVLIPKSDGCSVAAANMAPITGVRVATSRHDLMLVDCGMALERRFAFSFEPERRLRARAFSCNGHLPDGLLHRSGTLPIAIELELSAKPPRRLTAIFDAYAADLRIGEVWYVVVADDVERHLRRLAVGHDHVKIRRWRAGPPNKTKESAND